MEILRLKKNVITNTAKMPLNLIVLRQKTTKNNYVSVNGTFKMTTKKTAIKS